jgi:uncharacterized protein YgbK (DUF1537 family)
MKEDLLSDLAWEKNQVPDEQAKPLLNEIGRICRSGKIRIVVVDDDPTGSQTISDLPVITAWDQDLIEEVMGEDYPGFFILTNSRSIPENRAIMINREIAQLASAAARKLGYSLLLVSRGDSTLRGHFPAELLALNSGLGRNADGFVFMPYFREGGRFTINGTHYIKQDAGLLPVSSTDFARDPVFPFSSSDLKKYVWEKSGGQIGEEMIAAISVTEFDRGPGAIEAFLSSLQGGRFAVVDGTCLYHAAALALALVRQHILGRHLLVRCAPSLVQALFGMISSETPVDIRERSSGPAGGLIVVGSFVSQSTRQLNHLMQHTGILSVELEVGKISGSDQHAYLQALASSIATSLEQGKSVVLFTSRDLVAVSDFRLRAEKCAQVSDSLVTVIRELSVVPRYLVAKGGITASDIATRGLGIRKAMVLGQLLPGVQVWETDDTIKCSAIPFIIVPGNVGTDDYLTRIYQRLDNNAAD